MKAGLKSGILTILVITSPLIGLGQMITSSHTDSLQRVVQDYYELSLKVYRADSEIADIDRLFNLFTDDFVYIHEKYGGSYSRETLYEGYVRNQKNEAFDGSIVDLKLKNTIIGLNAVATERAYLQRATNGELKEIDNGMTLFEFEEGRISKIIEYW